jgi:DnaJ-class molecular chaperone
MYKTSFTRISHMRQSISLIRQLHYDYVMRSEIILQLPVQELNEYHTKVINFQPFRKSVSICTDCNGVGWKLVLCKKCNGTGFHPTPFRKSVSICGDCNGVGWKFVLCKKCNGTGFH